MWDAALVTEAVQLQPESNSRKQCRPPLQCCTGSHSSCVLHLLPGMCMLQGIGDAEQVATPAACTPSLCMMKPACKGAVCSCPSGHHLVCLQELRRAVRPGRPLLGNAKGVAVKGGPFRRKPQLQAAVA